MKSKNEQGTAQEKQISLCEAFVAEFGGLYLERAENLLFRALCEAFSEKNWDEAREIECHLSKLSII